MRGLTSGSFVKTYDLTGVSDIGVTGVEVYACERRFLERLQGAGLVPDLQSVEEEWENRAEIRLEFHLPLVMWLSDHRDGVSAMKAAIDEQLRRLHEHGVCHRPRCSLGSPRALGPYVSGCVAASGGTA